MRTVLLKLHAYVGLAAALFVLVLGLTGSIMAFEDEIDRATHPHLFTVTPEGAPLALAELGARVSAAHVGARVTGYGMGISPDRSWYVAAGGSAVYVNQYTGEILGERAGPTWLNQVHQLHLRLLAGETGRTIVSWAGVLMVMLTISGLCLWWPAKRVSVAWAAGGRRTWLDVHNASGAFSFVFLFVLSVTGVVIGFERLTTPLFYRVTGSQPAASTLAVTERPGLHLMTPDAAVAAARAAMPGAAPIAVNVAGPRSAYRVAMRFPEDLTPGGRTRVFVDPFSGAVVHAESSRTTAAGTRIVNMNRAIHTGDVFGVPSKIVMSLASLAAVIQVLSGLVMWWKHPKAAR
jgi:uncharacterized iron-regulated membrane protein